MQFSGNDQSSRINVLQALSGFLTGRELQGYVYKLMVHVLKEPGLNQEEILVILDGELFLRYKLTCSITQCR